MLRERGRLGIRRVWEVRFSCCRGGGGGRGRGKFPLGIRRKEEDDDEEE